MGSYDEIKVVKAHLEDGRTEGQSKPEIEASRTITLPRSQWRQATSENDVGYRDHLLGQRYSTQELTGIFLVNIELYQLADMYSLPDLQKIAIEKVLGAERFYVKCDFDQVLDFLWKITAEDDAPLRLAVYRRCTKNYETICLFPKIEGKLKELVGFVAWETMKMDLVDKEQGIKQERDTAFKQANLRNETLEAAIQELQLNLEEIAREKEQETSAAHTQAHAKTETLKSQVLILKRNLAGVNKALKTCKKSNFGLDNENRQLKGGLDDIKFEWQRWAVAYCDKCRRQGIGWTQLTGEWDDTGRHIWQCFSGSRWISSRK